MNYELQGLRIVFLNRIVADESMVSVTLGIDHASVCDAAMKFIIHH